MVLDIRYVAGIFDGEGSISVLINHDGYIVSHIDIGNTCKELIYSLHEMFGGILQIREPKSVAHQRMYRVRLNGQKALNTLHKLLPHLLVKKKQAALMIELLESCSPGGGRKKTPIQLVRSQQIVDELRVLNAHKKEAA